MADEEHPVGTHAGEEEDPLVEGSGGEDGGDAVDTGGEGAAAQPAATDVRAARIAELKQQRASLLSQRKAVIKELKNERRKRQRLMSRARLLSDEDLAAVLAARAAARAAAAPKAKAKAKAALVQSDGTTIVSSAAADAAPPAAGAASSSGAAVE